jgi:hypothetical protein
MKALRPKHQQQLQRSTTPTMESIDSGQVVISLYPIGHAMIPSSGIMPSQGDRHDNNPGATIELDPQQKLESMR